MIYIVIVLSSIMAFYFFVMAFLGEKENRKDGQESLQEKEVSSEVKEKTYYEMPQIEKVKDITYGIPQMPVEKEKNVTAQIPQIVENKNVTQTIPTVVDKKEEEKHERKETLNIPSFVNRSDDKIISDDEVI